MEEKFIAAIKEALEIEDHDVNLEDRFRDYEEWDSLNRLSLIAMLDDEFGVQIENKEFEQLKTVGDLLRKVREKAD
jgi:acyl carrier protein